MDYDKQFCLKLVDYGSLVEYFEFELPLTNSVKRKVCEKVYSKDEITEKTVNRASARIRALTLCNPSMNKFTTLTFREVLDYGTQLYKFKLFARRLKNRVRHILKYLCVSEYGARYGRFHFHYISNQPYIPKNELESIWQNGFVDVEFVDDPLRASSYLCKYMAKDFQKKTFNKKLYLASRSLVQPVVYRDDEVLDYMLENELILNKTEYYNHSFLGTIKKGVYLKSDSRLMHKLTGNKELPSSTNKPVNPVYKSAPSFFQGRLIP